jgi:hypothetical protein
MFLASSGPELLYTVSVRLAYSVVLVLLSISAALAATPMPAPGLRWAEGAPGCTLERKSDGRTYYEISTGDLDITLGVDNQELEKVRHRTVPMIGVLIALNYTGTEPRAVVPGLSTLEFVKHFQVVQRALDPDAMLKQLQQNMDDLTDEITRHEMRKHPESKNAREAELQQRLKDYTEMMDFVSTHSLRGGALDPSNRTATGWVFFSTKNRWIGPWRRPEQFVFRIPLNGTVFEFPLEVPPRGGKVELRHRPGE